MANEKQKGNENGNLTKTIAVLPFRLLDGAPDAEKPVLGIGLANALSTRLYNVEGLSITPSGSVFKIAGETSDPFALGERLGVDFVLDGHILPIREKTRVTVQLLRINDRSVLWAGQFDESETDIFALEDSISSRVAESLIPYLTTETGEYLPPEITGELAPGEIAVEQKPDAAPEIKAGEEKPKSPTSHDLLSEQQTLLWADHKSKKAASSAKLILAAIVGAVLFGTAVYFFNPKHEPSRIEIIRAKSLVILPFTDETGFAGSLGTGLAEALTSKLGAVKQLSVRPASAGRSFAGSVKDARTIGRELGARYVLRGTLRRTGEQTVVSAEVVNTETGQTMSLENLNASEGDLLSLQARITERLLQTLEIEPTAAERERLSKRYTQDNLAYELYLIGRFQMANRSVDNLKRAVETFSRAAERDPNFALAYVGLADAYALLNLYQVPPPPDGYQKSRQNAERALALDEGMAEAHTSLAYVKFYDQRDRAGAEREFRRAIELNPSYATAHHWFSLALTAMNRPAEAIEEAQVAQRLDPSSAIIKTATAIAYFYGRENEKALAECEKALQIDPGLIPAHKTMRWIYQVTGDYRGALAAFQKERSFSGGDQSDPGWMMVQAQVEAVGGFRDEARDSLKISVESREVRDNPAAYAYEIALAYTAIEDFDNALLWLEKSKAAGTHGFNFAYVDPRFDRLRNDPRYQNFTRELK